MHEVVIVQWLRELTQRAMMDGPDLLGGPTMHRYSSETLTFRKPFFICGELCPAGTYDFESEEELIEGLSFTAYRRVRTSVRITRRGFTEILEVQPNDLARAVAKDQSDMSPH
jgi:hypothetical protein